jgi:HlyD family secretion protein
MKRSTLVVLGILVAGSVALGVYQAVKPKPPTMVVTDKCERVAQLRSIVSATGEIRAKEFVDIQTEVAGVITEVAVREGESVKKGDILLRIDGLQLQAEVDAARAQVGASESDATNALVGVATAEANLASEKTSLVGVEVELAQSRITADRAAASFGRKRDLFQSKLIGEEEFEVAEAEANLAKQRLEFALARVEQAKAQLRAVATRVDAAKAVHAAALQRVAAAKASLARAEDLLGKTVLRAPLSGLITKLNVEKGERAVPGIQSNPIATLMTIADMSVIEAEISVDEADIVMVRVGAEAEVEVDALRDRKLRGIVTEVGQSPIQASSSSGGSQSQEGKDFKVVVRLSEPPAELRPGLTATAEIVSAVRDNVLVLPLQALTAREVEVDAAGAYVEAPMPSDEGAKPVAASAEQRQRMKELEGVFLLVDGRARFRPVKTGITGDMDIEILDGIAEGAEVVSGPYQALRTLKVWDRIAIDEKRQSERAARIRSQR